MTQNFITFEHPKTGITRTAPMGFNWRLLQFGALLPMYQREWKLCLLVVVCGALTFSVSNVLLAFFYNKLYVRSLVANGFLARNTEEGTIDQAEARLGRALPRHLPSDEPPPAAPYRFDTHSAETTKNNNSNTTRSTCPPNKPDTAIDSRAGTTISVMDHGTVQNRLLYPLQHHD
jgi:hypothetical protein